MRVGSISNELEFASGRGKVAAGFFGKFIGAIRSNSSVTKRRVNAMLISLHASALRFASSLNHLDTNT